MQYHAQNTLDRVGHATPAYEQSWFAGATKQRKVFKRCHLIPALFNIKSDMHQQRGSERGSSPPGLCATLNAYALLAAQNP
jgi:hypothetical protein